MKPRHYPVVLALSAVLVLSSFFLGSVRLPGQTASSPLPVADLSVERYFQHVSFLASDALKGRGNGTPELERAAEYIEAQFGMYGLKPAGDAGSFFQKFEITTGTEFGTGSSLTVDGAAAKPDADFAIIPFSSAGSFDGPVVFAGYGITAPELHWDDYAGIDAAGKAVIVFRHEPGENDDRSPFAGKDNTAHATFVNKAINAKNHGAKAIVFITDPNNHESEEDVVGAATRDSDGADMGILAVHATRDSLKPLVDKLNRTLSDVQRGIDTGMKPDSFELQGERIRIAADIQRVRKTVRNVIGAVPGSDDTLKNQWIVIGGHYDHLGLGDRNSLAPSEVGRPHHGADDNASGTAGVLELARLVSRNRNLFGRSILFMAFAGEELGLFGSADFVNHPTVPLDSIVGMINMDMIGRMTNDTVNVIGAGTSPNFKPWLEESNKTAGLKLTLSDSGHEGSDHVSFNSKRIPSLFFFSGLHQDYHRPSDTADKINSAGAVRILSLVAETAERMASSADRPQYTQIREAPGAPQQAASSGSGYGPYFGSVPDFRDDLNGVLFADVRSDSPAAKAGLKAGDLMVGFGTQSIQNLYDFTYALGSKKPGDVVPVTVVRDGQTIKVDVTLETRK